MQKNEINNMNNPNNLEISKQVENSLELLILYRSIYIIKQKFSLFKERIRNIYQKYNIYNSDLKCKNNIKIYQINIQNFVQVTDEVLQDLNLLLIKYLNPKDIFLSKILIEKKREETKKIINEILNWLLNDKNNGNDLIKNYNINFFNKKIKPYIEEDINYENFEKMIDIKENSDKDFLTNMSLKGYKMVTEYDRRGKAKKKYKTKILEENGEVDEDGITEVIDIKKQSRYYGNDNAKLNKEKSINFNDLSGSKNKSKKSDYINFIFIESLPLIIADFLQSHINNALIESEDELGRELKLLFDNEILKRLNEYKNILGNKSSILDNTNDKVFINKEEKDQKELNSSMEEYKKVKENIEIYRNILVNKKKYGENTDYIEKMIEKLMAKKVFVEHRIKLLMEKNNNNDISVEKNYNTNRNNNNIISADFIKTTGLTSRNNDQYENILHTSNQINDDINNLNNKKLSESNTKNTLKISNLNDKSISLISSNTNLASMKSNPRINDALEEIFFYYSQLHINVKKTRLFSFLEEKKSHLDLTEFSKFCTDFNIPIKRQKLVEVFKKSVSNLNFMNFKEFNNAIISLANATHESKKKKISDKIHHKKFELSSIILKENQMKEEKKLKRILYNNMNSDINIDNGGKQQKQNRSPSGYGYKINLKLEKKNIFDEISNNKINFNKEIKKSYQEIINDFYTFLGLNDPQEYRSKMRHNNMSPRKSNEKLNNNRDRNKSISSGEKSISRSKSFIHEELEKINIKKEEKLKKELMEKEKMKNKLYNEKVKLFNINNQRLKITVDRKSKKKSYLELMKEQQEEKTEIISMHNYQKNRLQNKIKERELKKIKDKEREKKIQKEKLKYLINNISKEESKEQLQLNEISEIKKEKEEDFEKRNDKNHIWWAKLEKYNIEDLGLNEEEKDLFIKSDLMSDEKDENVNDNKNNLLKNNNENNSFGALISDNSLLKSNSKGEVENNANNNDVKDKIIQPIHLPPINSSKITSEKEKEKNTEEIFKTNLKRKDQLLNINKNYNNNIF